MGILARLFGKPTRPKDEPKREKIHVGHFAAFGSKAAIMLSQQGIRHAAMTPEHVLWSAPDGGFRIVGWGNGRRLTWPDQAGQVLDDIRTFAEAFGREATAGLRFGYVYQLGPVGEWLFFAASRRGDETSAPSGEWLTQWEPPAGELSLGENGMLDSEARLTTDHRTADGEVDIVRAKRILMARMLRGIVSEDRVLQFSSLSELAWLFAREKRPLRALALGTAATCRYDPDDDSSHLQLAAVLDEVRRSTTKAVQADIERVVPEGDWSSLLQLVWKLEDVEIAEVIGRSRGT